MTSGITKEKIHHDKKDGKPFRPLHKEKLYLNDIGYILANPREAAIF